MPTQKSPIITLCKIANAIVRYPKKYPIAPSQRSYFSGIGSRIFSSQRLANASCHAPHTQFSGAEIKRHKLFISQVPTAGANSIVPLHCTSLDLHPPQHRTASVLRNAYPSFFPPLTVLDMPFYPCEFIAPLPTLLNKISFPIDFF